MTMMIGTTELMTIAQAAELLGVSVITLQQQARKGVLGATKLGKQWVVTGDAVCTYREERKGKLGFASPSHPFHGKRPPRIYRLSDREIAIHEAGHAVVAHALGFAVGIVSMIPDEKGIAWCEIHPARGGYAKMFVSRRDGSLRRTTQEEQLTEVRRALDRDHCIVNLAGVVAEGIDNLQPGATPTYRLLSAGSDIEESIAIIQRGKSGSGWVPAIERAVTRAERILKKPAAWATVVAIADALQAHRELDAETVGAMLRDGCERSAIQRART